MQSDLVLLYVQSTITGDDETDYLSENNGAYVISWRRIHPSPRRDLFCRDEERERLGGGILLGLLTSPGSFANSGRPSIGGRDNEAVLVLLDVDNADRPGSLAIVEGPAWKHDMVL